MHLKSKWFVKENLSSICWLPRGLYVVGGWDLLKTSEWLGSDTDCIRIPKKTLRLCAWTLLTLFHKKVKNKETKVYYGTGQMGPTGSLWQQSKTQYSGKKQVLRASTHSAPEHCYPRSGHHDVDSCFNVGRAPTQLTSVIQMAGVEDWGPVQGENPG